MTSYYTSHSPQQCIYAPTIIHVHWLPGVFVPMANNQPIANGIVDWERDMIIEQQAEAPRIIFTNAALTFANTKQRFTAKQSTFKTQTHTNTCAYISNCISTNTLMTHK